MLLNSHNTSVLMVGRAAPLLFVWQSRDRVGRGCLQGESLVWTGAGFWPPQLADTRIVLTGAYVVS